MIECTEQQLFILAIGALGLGMYMLLKGGNWTIDASVFVAKHLGISPLVIGFTIVAFGTSLPELIVSINANLAGSPGIAVGNVVGSNIANILLVIGATTLFATLSVQPKDILRDTVVMLLATLVMIALMLHGEISRLVGGVMIAFLVGYIFLQYKESRAKKIKPEELDDPVFQHMKVAIVFLILGLICIALGAEFLVRGAKVSAAIIGVPEAVIGLSVIALGTSLPELSTSIVAVMKKHSEIAIGNIIGSNVFNILMILGATALVKPIVSESIAEQIVTLDMWVALGVAVVFSALLLGYKKLTKPIGILFLAGYVFYIVTIYGLYLNGETLKAIAG